MGHRNWGKEILMFVSDSAWSMKRLQIQSGSKGGLQYHHFKDEAIYLVSGSLLVRYVDPQNQLQTITLSSGESLRFPPHCIHQEEALTDCIMIEVSTPHYNDRVRMELDYGMEQVGLPSTSSDEVKLLTEEFLNQQ